MAPLLRVLRKRYAVEVEMGIAAAVLLVWQAVRIPLEGDVATSLAHARDVLRAEAALGVDVEGELIRVGSGSSVDGFLHWAYGEVHTPALFAFLAAACVLAPARYPRIRNIYALSFVPALLVIGLYPLAPPKWLPEFGLGATPTDDELTGTMTAFFQNSTAAAASQHFGFAMLIAFGALWLFPRAPVAWGLLGYPAFVFLVIVATGNHYVVDCVIGTLTFALATGAAWAIHREPVASRAPRPAGTGSAALVIVGFAMLAWGVESLESIATGAWSAIFPDALILVGGIVAIAAPRLSGRAVPA